MVFVACQLSPNCSSPWWREKAVNESWKQFLCGLEKQVLSFFLSFGEVWWWKSENAFFAGNKRDNWKLFFFGVKKRLWYAPHCHDYESHGNLLWRFYDPLSHFFCIRSLLKCFVENLLITIVQIFCFRFLYCKTMNIFFSGLISNQKHDKLEKINITKAPEI